MIWGCFSDTRIGSLLTFEQGGIRADDYIEILYDGPLSMVNDLLQPLEDSDTIQVTDEHIFLFIYNNASCHKMEEMHEPLQENIPVMIWPANSPDLNPIKNL